MILHNKVYSKESNILSKICIFFLCVAIILPNVVIAHDISSSDPDYPTLLNNSLTQSQKDFLNTAVDHCQTNPTDCGIRTPGFGLPMTRLWVVDQFIQQLNTPSSSTNVRDMIRNLIVRLRNQNRFCASGTSQSNCRLELLHALGHYRQILMTAPISIGVTPPTGVTAEQLTGWKNCVTNILQSQSTNGNAGEVYNNLIVSPTGPAAQRFLDAYNERGCGTTYLATMTDAPTDTRAILTLYNEQVGGVGGMVPIDPNDGISTDPAVGTCGSFPEFIIDKILGVTGISYMLCQLIVVAREFLDTVLDWMGVPEGIGSVNSGSSGGGVGVVPGAGAP